jgi:hypothetical protein
MYSSYLGFGDKKSSAISNPAFHIILKTTKPDFEGPQKVEIFARRRAMLLGRQSII